MIGKTLGHYHILEELGAGGMGVVYRARDAHLERDVAIKVLPAGTVADESVRTRFRKEALLLSSLNHPNIETVHDFASQDDVDFLVMEFVPGVTLSDRLVAGPLSEKEIVRLGEQLCDGLAAAHGVGVVHRDLKPANLRITPDGRLKILDFGLARLLRQPDALTQTHTATDTQAVAGTVPYMAPEQLRGERFDFRSDIFSAGAVLYEMATAKRPFHGETGAALADSILNHPPVTPRALNPALSPRLEETILKCLEKDPDSRYQSPREIAVDLRRLAVSFSGALPPASQVSQPPRRFHVMLWLVSAAVVLAAVLAIALNVGGVRNRLSRGYGRPALQSLAILPLENMSRDPEQEYFADGMTEALIADLSKIRALRVISRTSVMMYKGTRKPLPVIAQELGVDAVLEGSVFRAGNRIRITAQLMRGSPEEHLWADSYERDAQDVLAVQSEVAQAVAREIRIKLAPQDQARLGKARPVNPAAHEAYLKGRYYLTRPRSFGKSEESLQQAIKLDPLYAPAHAALAELHVFTLPAKDHMPVARFSAAKALEIDESLSEAHVVMGLVRLFYEWNWVAAEKEFTRALELDPGSATARHRYSNYLQAMGRLQEAISEGSRARDLDPLAWVIGLDLGRSFYFARRYDEAIAQYRKVIELEPNSGLAHLFLGVAYEQKGQFREAADEIVKSRRLAGENAAADSMERVFASGGYQSFIQAWISAWEQQFPKGTVQPSSIAMVYSRLGNSDKVSEWLEKGFAERARSMVFLKVEPQWDPVRCTPKFQDLVRRLNLPLDVPCK